MSNRQPSVIDVIESFLLGISCLVGGDQFYLLLSHTGFPITSQYIVLVITILVTFIATLICDRTSDLSINGVHLLYTLLLSTLILFVKQRIKSLFITTMATLSMGVTLTYLILQACTCYSRSRRSLQSFLLGLFTARVFPSFVWYLIKKRYMDYQLQLYSVSLTLVIFRFSACLTSMLIKVSRKKFGFSNKQPSKLYQDPNSYTILAGDSVFLNFCKKVRLCLFPVAVFLTSIALYLTFPPTMLAKHFNYSPNFISSINLMEMTFHLLGSCFGIAYPVSSTGNEPGFYFITLFFFVLYTNSLLMFYYVGSRFSHYYMFLIVMVSGFSLGYLWSYTLYIVFNTTLMETCILKEHLHIHCCCDMFSRECYCRYSKMLKNMYPYFTYPVMNRFLCYKPDGIPTYKYSKDGTHAIILCHPDVDVFTFFRTIMCDSTDCSFLYLIGIYILESVTTSTCSNCQLTVRLEGSKLLLPGHVSCSDIVSSGGLLGSECSKFCLSVKCCSLCSPNDEIKFRSCKRCNSVCKSVYMPEKTCENSHCKDLPDSCFCPSPFTQPTRLYYCFSNNGNNYFREIGPYTTPDFDGDLKLQNDFYIKNVDISNCCHSDLKIDLHCGMKNNFFRLTQLEYKNKCLKVDSLKLISMPIEVSQDVKQPEKTISQDKKKAPEKQTAEKADSESQVTPSPLPSSPAALLEPPESSSTPLNEKSESPPTFSETQTSSSDNMDLPSEGLSEPTPAPQTLTSDSADSQQFTSDSQTTDTSPSSDNGQSESQSSEQSTFESQSSVSPLDESKSPSTDQSQSEPVTTAVDSQETSSHPGQKEPPSPEDSNKVDSHSPSEDSPHTDALSSEVTQPSSPDSQSTVQPPSEDVSPPPSPSSGHLQPPTLDQAYSTSEDRLSDNLEGQTISEPLVGDSLASENTSSQSSENQQSQSESPLEGKSSSGDSLPTSDSSSENTSATEQTEQHTSEDSSDSSGSVPSHNDPSTSKDSDSISDDKSKLRMGEVNPAQREDGSGNSSDSLPTPEAIVQSEHSDLPSATAESESQSHEDSSPSTSSFNVHSQPAPLTSESGLASSEVPLSNLDKDLPSVDASSESEVSKKPENIQESSPDLLSTQPGVKSESSKLSNLSEFILPPRRDNVFIFRDTSSESGDSQSSDSSSDSDSNIDSQEFPLSDRDYYDSVSGALTPTGSPGLPENKTEMLIGDDISGQKQDVSEDLTEIKDSVSATESTQTDPSSSEDTQAPSGQPGSQVSEETPTEPSSVSEQDSYTTPTMSTDTESSLPEKNSETNVSEKPDSSEGPSSSDADSKESSTESEPISAPQVSSGPEASSSEDTTSGSEQVQQFSDSSSSEQPTSESQVSAEKSHSESPSSEESPSEVPPQVPLEPKDSESLDVSSSLDGSSEHQPTGEEHGPPQPASVAPTSDESSSEGQEQTSPQEDSKGGSADLTNESSGPSGSGESGSQQPSSSSGVEPSPVQPQQSESSDNQGSRDSSTQKQLPESSGSTEQSKSPTSSTVPSPVTQTSQSNQVTSPLSPQTDKCQCPKSRLSKITLQYKLTNKTNFMLEDYIQKMGKQELTRREDTCKYSDECKTDSGCCLVCTLKVDSVSSFVKRIDTVRVKLVCIAFSILGTACFLLMLCIFCIRHNKIEPFIFDPVISFKELMNRREIYSLNTSNQIKRIMDQSLKFSGTTEMKKAELDQMQRLFHWILEREDYHSLIGYIRSSADEFLRKEGKQSKLETIRWCISTGFIYAYLATIFKPIQKFFAYWEELWQGEYSDYRRLMSSFINKVSNKSKFALSLLSEVKITEQGINLINRTRLVTWTEVLDELKRYTELYSEESNLIEEGIPVKFDLRLHHYLDRWNHRVDHIKYLTESQRSVFDWKPFLVYYENFSVWFDYFSIFIERFVEIISIPVKELKKNTSVFANYRI